MKQLLATVTLVALFVLSAVAAPPAWAHGSGPIFVPKPTKPPQSDPPSTPDRVPPMPTPSSPAPPTRPELPPGKKKQPP